MTLNDLVIRSAVLKMLADRITTALANTKAEVAAELGPEGRKNAVLDGQKIGLVTVTKTGRVRITSESALLGWVQDTYPTEVETVLRVRPAFLNLIKSCSEAAGEACGPGGELDIPGVEVGDPYPMVRKSPGGEELVERLWREGRLTLDGDIKEIE